MEHFEHGHLADNLDDSFSHIGGGRSGGGFGGGGGRPMGGGGFGGGRMGGGIPAMARPAMARPTAPAMPRTAPAPAMARPAVTRPAVTAPAVTRPAVARAGRTAQQRHNAMVSRFYRNRPYGGYNFNRRIGITPYGRRWWGGFNGYLFGYGYDFWYPFFYALSSGDVYDELALKEKYNLSDEDWNELVNKLAGSGYIQFNY